MKVNCSVEENANLSLMLRLPTGRPLYGIAHAGRALAIGSGKLLTLGHDQWMYLLRRWFRLPGSVSASSPGL